MSYKALSLQNGDDLFVLYNLPSNIVLTIYTLVWACLNSSYLHPCVLFAWNVFLLWKTAGVARAQCRRFLVMFENFNTPESTIPCNNLSFAVHRCWTAIINIQYMIHWLWSLRLLHILHNLFVCNHWMLRSLTSFYSWPVKDIRCDVLGKLASEVK